MGLPLLKRAAESTGGSFKIYNSKNGGVILKFEINIAHIDAKPFGDIARAFVDAIYSWPEVSFNIFVQKKNNRKSSIFNSKKIREVVSYSEMQQKEVRDFIYDSIDRELKTIRIDSQFGIF